MKLAIGSDHRGVRAMKALEPDLRSQGHEVTVLGECTGSSCDYPDSAFLVGSAVANGQAERGILICGSGIGMSIAANKVDGVRAALVSDELGAELSRAHNDTNVICLAGDLVEQTQIGRIIDIWLRTQFDGGRHARRVAKIMEIERGGNPANITAESQAQP
ncbi:MAG: ribose 5-phosphate isomerase B [Phycisphaerales bacterium]